MGGSSADGLRQLVDCATGCGFKGDAQNHSLCSKCLRDFKLKARSLSDADAIAHALEMAGFLTLGDAKLSLLVQKRGSRLASAPPVQIPGAQDWKTSIRPYTQFDEFPEKGTTACTYIAGLCALWACAGNQLPRGKDWAQCITLGIRAYHTARQENPEFCSGTTDLQTALPFIMRVAPFAPGIQAPSLKETLLLLADPRQLSRADAEQACCVGLSAEFLPGREGLCSYFRNVFAVGARSAVVVVKPPETWCIVSDTDGRIALRDSHRRTQFDFEHLESFQSWLLKDHAPSNMFFGASVKCGLESNLVELYHVTSADIKPNEKVEESAPTSQEHLPTTKSKGDENSKLVLIPERETDSSATLQDAFDVAPGSQAQPELASGPATTLHEHDPTVNLGLREASIVTHSRERSSSPSSTTSGAVDILPPAEEQHEAAPRPATTMQESVPAMSAEIRQATHVAPTPGTEPSSPLKGPTDVLLDRVANCISQAGATPADLMVALDGHQGNYLYSYEVRDLLRPIVPEISHDEAVKICRKVAGNNFSVSIDKQALQQALEDAARDASKVY